jgi:uroporphyrinogen-III synthase
MVADYDWVVFTSTNAVRFLLAGMSVGLDSIRSRRIAAVGQATAAALERAGVPVHAVPESSSGSAVAGAMAAKQELAGLRVLWPRAANARPDLKRALTAAGAHVHDVEAYASQPIPENARKLQEALEAGAIDMLTFTSPSAIYCFTEAGYSVPERVHVAVIGPVTAGAARSAGMRVDIESPNAAAEDMATAVLKWLRASSKDVRDV